jgi:hypothetical protein
LHYSRAYSLPFTSARGLHVAEPPSEQIHPADYSLVVQESDGDGIAKLWRPHNSELDSVFQEQLPVEQGEHAAERALLGRDGRIEVELEGADVVSVDTRLHINRCPSCADEGDALDLDTGEGRLVDGELRRGQLRRGQLGASDRFGEMLLEGGRATEAFDGLEDLQVPGGRIENQGIDSETWSTTYSDCLGVCAERRVISRVFDDGSSKPDILGPCFRWLLQAQ